LSILYFCGIKRYVNPHDNNKIKIIRFIFSNYIAAANTIPNNMAYTSTKNKYIPNTVYLNFLFIIL